MRKLFWVFIVILSIGGALSAQNPDKVYLKGSRRPIECDIEKDTYYEIAYSLGGGALVHMKWDRIERVVYGNMELPPYSLAERYFERKEYANAGKAYANTIRHRDEPWVKPYAGYKGGMCYFYLGKYKWAVQMFVQALKVRESRFEPQCLIMAGRCLLKLNKPEQAKKYLDRVISKKYGRSFKAQAEAVSLDILFSQEKYALVLPRYSHIRDTISDPLNPTRLSIGVKIGLCTVYTGKFTAGMKEISDVISKTVEAKKRGQISSNDADSILVSAYTGRGNGYYKVKKDPGKGLRAYLHAAVTYSHIGGREVAEASYNAARCIADLYPAEQSAPVKKEMKAKALELCMQAKQLYGKSGTAIRRVNKLIEKIESL